MHSRSKNLKCVQHDRIRKLMQFHQIFLYSATTGTKGTKVYSSISGRNGHANPKSRDQ